jgi:N-acetyl sugar amidotransferase
MIYCRCCVTPNTRPNGRFNADGICVPCEFAGQSREINYHARFDELRRLVSRKISGQRNRRWQCIVGVSGGKDSTRQALWVREKLGLNPLLVSVAYPPRQITQVGADNLSNLINLGFDTLVVGPAPRLSRALVREAFLRFCNWCKATEMCLFSGVPQIAIDKGIRLILWGENPALQVGDMGMMGDSIWDGSNMVNSNTLAGGDLTWFREVAGGDRRLSPYKFPSREALRRARVQTVFLGPAWEDWSGEVNSVVAVAHGLGVRSDDPRNTGDMLGTSMIDEDWTIVNNLLKFYKLGFSRGTEQANTLIRTGRITRAEGIAMAEAYDEACSDAYIESFCRYVNLTVDEFWAVVRKFAHKELFDCSGRRPVKRFKVGEGLLRAA